MGPFRFRLGKVLDWRDSEYQLEQSRLAAAYAALAHADQELMQLRATQLKLERALLACPSITAAELQAMEESRRRAKAQEKRLRENIQRCEREIGIQIDRVKVAKVKLHFLEMLRERRLSEHTAAVNRELEELAAESYLAKYARGR